MSEPRNSISPELKVLMDNWQQAEIEKKGEMPLYKFVCRNCNIEEKILLRQEQAEKFSGGCKICGQPLAQVMGLPSSDAKITADEYRDKKVASDLDKKLDDRAKEHFNKHELPRLIADKGIEWCKKNGFVDADGRPK